MLVGRRFRVRFTPDQMAYADEVAGICRAVWNTGLDQRPQYRQRRAWINYPQQARELVETKLDPDPALPAVGIDRGVAVALALSDGRMLDQDFTSAREQAAIVRLQQKAARQRGPRVPGTCGRKGRRAPSKRWARTQARIAKKLAKQGRRRDDFTAKTAGTLTRSHSLIAVEDLRVANMTRRAAPKPDPDQPGVFLPNRAAAKSGLNRAILDKGWGRFLLALQYQARYTGSRIVLVPAAFTSQRCHQCQHVSAGNRESQASFRCTRCAWHGNADTNAALNILAAGLGVASGWRPAGTAAPSGSPARCVRRSVLANRTHQIAAMHLGAVDAALTGARAVLAEAADLIDAGSGEGPDGMLLAARVRAIVPGPPKRSSNGSAIRWARRRWPLTSGMRGGTPTSGFTCANIMPSVTRPRWVERSLTWRSGCR